MEARCPTFSWGAHSGATAYELVVYEVSGDSTSEEPLTFGEGVQFSDRVITTESMTGSFFVSETTAGNNVCAAVADFYHPCSAWEAMVLDTLSADVLFSVEGWVAGSFPNTEPHMRSLASGQDSLVCPTVGTHLTKFPSQFLHGTVISTGGIHCRSDTESRPVYCCRDKY